MGLRPFIYDWTRKMLDNRCEPSANRKQEHHGFVSETTRWLFASGRLHENADVTRGLISYNVSYRKATLISRIKSFAHC